MKIEKMKRCERWKMKWKIIYHSKQIFVAVNNPNNKYEWCWRGENDVNKVEKYLSLWISEEWKRIFIFIRFRLAEGNSQFFSAPAAAEKFYESLDTLVLKSPFRIYSLLMSMNKISIGNSTRDLTRIFYYLLWLVVLFLQF